MGSLQESEDRKDAVHGWDGPSGSRLTWCHSWAPSISCMASRASSSKSCDPPDSDSVREGGLRSPFARLAASSSSSSPAHAHIRLTLHVTMPRWFDFQSALCMFDDIIP